MPKIVDRYLAREMATGVAATAMVLLVITVGGTFADVVRNVAVGGLPAAVLFPLLGLKLVDALTILLPLAVFLGILSSLGRVWRDSEMHVLAAAGMGPRSVLRPAALLVLPVAALVGVLSLWLAPLANRSADQLLARANSSLLGAGLEAGRFLPLHGRDGMVFIERINAAGSELGGVTVINETVDADGAPRVELVTAARGSLAPPAADGSRHLVLEDGHRYAGQPGANDWLRMGYARNTIVLPEVAGAETVESIQGRATLALIGSEDPALQAELAWRMAVPATVLVLALLALPLAGQSPREPRYSRLLLAILAYLLYANLLALMRTGIAREAVPAWLGLWPVQFAALALASWLLWRQGRPRPPAAARTAAA